MKKKRHLRKKSHENISPDPSSYSSPIVNTEKKEPFVKERYQEDGQESLILEDVKELRRLRKVMPSIESSKLFTSGGGSIELKDKLFPISDKNVSSPLFYSSGIREERSSTDLWKSSFTTTQMNIKDTEKQMNLYIEENLKKKKLKMEDEVERRGKLLAPSSSSFSEQQLLYKVSSASSSTPSMTLQDMAISSLIELEKENKDLSHPFSKREEEYTAGSSMNLSLLTEVDLGEESKKKNILETLEATKSLTSTCPDSRLKSVSHMKATDEAAVARYTRNFRK